MTPSATEGKLRFFVSAGEIPLPKHARDSILSVAEGLRLSLHSKFPKLPKYQWPL